MPDFAPKKGMAEAAIEGLIDAVLAEATLNEKVGMMSGHGFFKQYLASNKKWGADPYRAGGGIERLGIEPFYFTDGPRGVARGSSTCFPCTMARGASFDVDLERRVGEVMGIEARAQGCNLSGAVCVNLLRHPAWGRGQETYGEDQHHLGEMGAALGVGIQTHNVAATVKHYALNSIENARFKIDVKVDERTLREVYLPHFKRILDAGIRTVMSAYNKVNGEYCGQHRELLTDILRTEWGFDGFVHSDWVQGVYQLYGAAAGLDVENPEPRVFGDKLVEAVRQGSIEPQVIDQACRRILRVYYRIACAEDPLPAYDMTMVAQPSHRALALEVAEKSAVLLVNRNTLPFDAAKIKKLALLGRLAGLHNTGDMGSSRVRPPYVVTPAEGLQRFLLEHSAGSIVAADESDLAACTAAARLADAVVVVVGFTAREEGEFIPGDISHGQEGTATAAASQTDGANGSFGRGGDRADLELPAAQIAMIEAVAATGKPVVVVIVAGSAVLVERWHEKPGAILQTFYAGMEGGTALAKLLFGIVSPSGKLPFTVARDAGDYPFFDRNADAIEYGYLQGYAKLLHEQREPRFAFGHGLSYASFSYRALQAVRAKNEIRVSVAVRNDGSVAAEELVQCYVGFPGRIQPRARHSLKAFARASLAPGETRVVRLTIPIDSLRYWNTATRSWKLEGGTHRVMVARSAADPAPLFATLEF